MRGVFEDEERELAPPRHDTELTLGSGTVLVLILGLILLCGLCFGLGYAAGHHGSSEPAAGVQSAETPATLQANGSHSKPSATPQSGVAQAEQTVVETPTADQAQGQAPPASDGNPTSGSQNPQASSSAEPNQIRPALPSLTNSPPPNQPPPPSAVQPTVITATAGLMVQIAAVSNPEDANVLVNALLKRGYAVIARRDGADGLIHVRIGPFNSVAEANQWRKKLLDDGYNAVVQP